MTDRGHFTQEQRDVLLKPIHPGRVHKANNQSHLPAFDVDAHLTRIFGFDGWDKEILELTCIHQHLGHHSDASKKGWYITYLCRMRLTIHSPDGKIAKVIDDAATGSAQNYPSIGDAHDFACKNAVSFALKRCAKDLGDQFGLSLYNKGATGALVKKLVLAGADDVQADLPAPQSLGNDEIDRSDEDPDGGVSQGPQETPPSAPSAAPATPDDDTPADDPRATVKAALDAIPDERARIEKKKAFAAAFSCAPLEITDKQVPLALKWLGRHGVALPDGDAAPGVAPAPARTLPPIPGKEPHGEDTPTTKLYPVDQYFTGIGAYLEELDDASLADFTGWIAEHGLPPIGDPASWNAPQARDAFEKLEALLRGVEDAV